MRDFWYLVQRVGALGMLTLLLPVFALLYAAVRLTSRGPFLYSQLRPGYLGRPIRVWKIRTMHIGADRNAALARGVPTASSEVTAVGRFLRRSKLDELPQLLNIARGDMALVGPRPIATSFFTELCEKIDGFQDRLSVRPGLTNLGQVCIEENAGPERMLDDWRIRFEAEKHYLRHRSPWYDLVIITLTAAYVLRKLAPPSLRWQR